MLVKDSTNFPVWERVFEQLGNFAPDTSPLDGKVELIYDGANMDCYPEISILGVFKIATGRFIAISFSYDADYGTISDPKMEDQRRLEDLQTVFPEEKEVILARC